MSDDAKGAPAWIVTFSDIMSLLVTFFVLILTWSTLEIEKFELAVGSLRGAFGAMSEERDQSAILERDRHRHRRSDIQGMLDPCEDESVERNFRKAAVKLRQYFGEEVEAERLRKGYRIRIAADTLFEPGCAEPTPACREALAEIARVLRPLCNAVRIDGHTDDQFRPSAAFPTGWCLSTARAAAAARHLVEAGGIDPRRLSIAGYAGTRPAFPNRSAALRARNRRIEITVLALPKHVRR